MTDVKTVLMNTRTFLATGKWCKDMLNDAEGNCCLLGAMYSGDNLQALSPDKVMRLGSYIRPYIPERFRGSIATFNDDPDTKLEDVLAVLDKAIEACNE